MEKLLLLVQVQEKCPSTEFKMKKLKTDSKTPILLKKNFTNWLNNLRMLSPKVKLNKEDGQNGFMEFQSLELTFIAQY